MQDFTINVKEIGYYSFASEDITFEKLTIGEDVSTFRMNGKGYNRAFNGNIIKLLCYNATQGQMEKLSSSVYGPISISFDSEQKSYIGKETLFAYGTLGNAYEGVRLAINKEVESYGTAIMGENSYNISKYLSVGFTDGESVIFEPNQILENAAYVKGEGTDSFHQEQMTVEGGISKRI